jgi:hypothetical protein
MSLFPDDRRVADEKRDHLASHFDYAQRLLRYWVGAHKDSGLARSKLPTIVLRAALSMAVKISRQFRSAIELCERGEAADGAVIARSMFETALPVGFVLKPRFVPREFGPDGKVKKRVPVSGPKLTRQFQATLFFVHQFLDPARHAARHAARLGMKRDSKRAAKFAGKIDNVLHYKAAIGPDWEAILMRRRTYSGLNISDMARSLGKPFSKWYDIVYGDQSTHVHAADPLHHVQLFDDAGITRPQWHSSVEHVARTLAAAITMFYVTISILNEQIKFGVAMNTALGAFSREYKQLMKTP